jgi:hypothetical protein
MKDNCKKIIGSAAKIIKRFFIVIVVVYYGALAVIDLVIYPSVTGKFPEHLGYVRYVFGQGTEEADGENPLKMAMAAVSVSIPDLLNAYRENAMKADRTYTGKILRLTGKAGRIGKGYSSDSESYYLTLEPEEADLDGPPLYVQVYLKKKEVPNLEALVAGQTVTVIGKCNGDSPFLEIEDAFFESGFTWQQYASVNAGVTKAKVKG